MIAVAGVAARMRHIGAAGPVRSTVHLRQQLRVRARLVRRLHIGRRGEAAAGGEVVLRRLIRRADAADGDVRRFVKVRSLCRNARLRLAAAADRGIAIEFVRILEGVAEVGGGAVGAGAGDAAGAALRARALVAGWAAGAGAIVSAAAGAVVRRLAVGRCVLATVGLRAVRSVSAAVVGGAAAALVVTSLLLSAVRVAVLPRASGGAIGALAKAVS